MNVYKEGGIYVIESDVYEDDRGYFLESYSEKSLLDIGLNVNFVQDNISKSTKGVLRGLHYQLENPQGKMVRCIKGSVLDVSVDIRVDSPTFGKVTSKVLNDKTNMSLYIPVGCAHGFFVWECCGVYNFFIHNLVVNFYLVLKVLVIFYLYWKLLDYLPPIQNLYYSTLYHIGHLDNNNQYIYNEILPHHSTQKIHVHILRVYKEIY